MLFIIACLGSIAGTVIGMLSAIYLFFDFVKDGSDD